MNAQAANDGVKKYGYVPVTFPRDPAEVNLFAEHIVLGQIIEPIVDTDQFGKVIPGIAESWTFEDKGLTVHFKIKKDRKFSNGKTITAKDVKYTLQRSLDLKSQSSNFLNVVSSIKASDAENLYISLREPNVAILKALSRDQLGVVPEGWQFDKNSQTPFIGSGPYNLKREGSKWLLVENESYQGTTKPSIKKWELLFFADAAGNIPTDLIPDYAPAISNFAKKNLTQIKAAQNLTSSDHLSFAQTSAWWHPSGIHYKSLQFQKRAMQLVEEMMVVGTKALQYDRATGVIPKGVAGHSDKAPHVAKVDVPQKQELDKLKIGTLGALFDELFLNKELFTIAKKHGFDLEIVKIPQNDSKNISEKKIDVVLAGWAGGFNDPEGFIALLPTYLGKDFVSYIGPELAEIYKKSRVEQDWTLRSSLFQKVNEGLRTSQLMVPGWKIPLYVVGKPSFITNHIAFRYTPRLQLVNESQ